MLEKATKQEDDTDIQNNIDDVEGGVENLDSILAEMQDFPDDEQMNAQLHDMAANKQAPATAQLRVTYKRLYRRARNFGNFEYRMLNAITRYIRRYQGTMNSYYRYLSRYSG